MTIIVERISKILLQYKMKIESKKIVVTEMKAYYFSCRIIFAAFVLFFSAVLNLNAQDSIRVEGTVLGALERPLSGISVSIEGSEKMPVFTDNSGSFSLTGVAPESWLVFTAPSGYKSRRMNVNNRDYIKIYLTPVDISSGDDQVSFLNKSVPKKNMIAAFTELDMGDVETTRTTSLDHYMQGRVPGVYVTRMSSQPGAGAVAMIRGLTTLNANTQPLYVVDGVPVTPHNIYNSQIDGYFYNPLLGVNPLDISKVTVVKDPSISAIYGSKASNGLILIETLDPSATQTVIDVQLRSGYNLRPERYIPLLNAKQHKTLISEMLTSSGMLEEEIREEYPLLFLEPGDDRFIDLQHNTDWQKTIFNNSFYNNANISVKGGDEIARYGLSVGTTLENGIIKSTDYQSYNLRFVGTLNIFRWLKMNTGVSIVNSSSNLKESARIEETSPVFTSLSKSPMLNPYQYDVNEKEIDILSEVTELGISNPVAAVNNYLGTNRNNEFQATLGLEGTIMENMIIDSKFGLGFNVLKENIFMPNQGMNNYYNLEAQNVAVATNNSYRNFFNNTNLNYSTTINEVHRITSSLGMNLRTNQYQFDWGLTKNAHRNDQYRRLQDGTNNLREMGGDNKNWNWISFYENLTYAYNNKYLAMATVNVDGSSRIGDNADNTVDLMGQPFGLFYSGGLAWVISRESFLNDLFWLDLLKLRVTTGKNGNDDIGDGTAIKSYSPIRFRQTTGLYPAELTNDEITYETVMQNNAGMDISLLGYRFSLSFDVFRKKTEDMLVYLPIEPYFGYKYRAENGGSMQNTGWEFSGFFRIVSTNSFTWDIEANLSSTNNEILDIAGNKLIIPFEGGELVNIEGEEANSFYGYIFKGVYATTEEAQEANLLNSKATLFEAGDAIYEDLSGPEGTPDGVIDEFDKTIIGSAIPDLFGGLITSISYKRWSLSAFLQFTSGNDIFNYVRYKNERLTGLENQNVRTLNRWQYEGHETEIPRAIWNDPYGNSAFSTRWIEDGSYVRLKNVTLSYVIPEEFLTFRNAKFFVSAQNLFTYSKYLGYDPETTFSFSSPGQGVDYGLAPQMKSFMVGINFGL